MEDRQSPLDRSDLDDLRNSVVDDPETEAEILTELERLLGEPYERAKRTHIWAEEERGEHNWVAMTNFRDALDHMSKIFNDLEQDDIDGARENLGEMEAHIQRAAFDSAQSVPDKKLDQYFNERVPPTLYTITRLDAPSKAESERRLQTIREQMVKGREKKAKSMEESVKAFKVADDHISKLLQELPSRREVQYRLIILGGVFVSVVALLLTIASFNVGVL